MDLFFTLQNKYTVSGTFATVKKKVGDIANCKWYNSLENNLDSLEDDNTFKFTADGTVGFIVLGMPLDLTYLKGKIEQEENNVIIKIETHPHYLMVVVFYFLLFEVVANLFKLSYFIADPSFKKFLLYLLFCIIIGGLMQVSTISLRNQFDKIIVLKLGELIKNLIKN